MAPLDPPSDDDAFPRRPVKPVLPSARGRTLKLAENTVQGCRDRATADLLEAVTVMTANQRRRLERSAESWTVRAALLDRLNKSFEKRDAIDRAHKQYEIDHVRI
jgi:predicted RNA polymerase sigma factor